jgi:hypothetical protein
LSPRPASWWNVFPYFTAFLPQWNGNTHLVGHIVLPGNFFEADSSNEN